MSKMVTLIVGVTVSIIIFVSVLVPIISEYTTGEDPIVADSTLRTLITVCGTLTIIAILMMVVRALGNKQ